jgi:hypothetical protein
MLACGGGLREWVSAKSQGKPRILAKRLRGLAPVWRSGVPGAGPGLAWHGCGVCADHDVRTGCEALPAWAVTVNVPLRVPGDRECAIAGPGGSRWRLAWCSRCGTWQVDLVAGVRQTLIHA